MFRFERLDVWRKGLEFAEMIYDVTRTFPDDERFGLVSQMRRSVVSISSNVAEGSGRSSNKDFAHFVEIAYGSLMEVLSQIAIAERRSYINNETKTTLYQRGEQLARMLSGLRSSLRKDTTH